MTRAKKITAGVAAAGLLAGGTYVVMQPAAVAPRPEFSQTVGVSWIARGSNGVALANGPTRVLWTDNLTNRWLAMATSTTGRATFYSTNRVGWFKVEPL